MEDGPKMQGVRVRCLRLNFERDAQREHAGTHDNAGVWRTGQGRQVRAYADWIRTPEPESPVYCLKFS